MSSLCALVSLCILSDYAVHLIVRDLTLFSTVAILVNITSVVSLCAHCDISTPVTCPVIFECSSVTCLGCLGNLYLYPIMWPALLCVPSVLLSLSDLYLECTSVNLVTNSWNLVFRDRRSSIYIVTYVSGICHNISLDSHLGYPSRPWSGMREITWFCRVFSCRTPHLSESTPILPYPPVSGMYYTIYTNGSLLYGVYHPVCCVYPLLGLRTPRITPKSPDLTSKSPDLDVKQLIMAV